MGWGRRKPGSPSSLVHQERHPAASSGKGEAASAEVPLGQEGALVGEGEPGIGFGVLAGFP